MLERDLFDLIHAFLPSRRKVGIRDCRPRRAGIESQFSWELWSTTEEAHEWMNVKNSEL
jgi:hypothetical protein